MKARFASIFKWYA